MFREGDASASPPYPPRSGPVLVAGNAACLPEDLDGAREVFPEAAVIAVNGACKLIPAFAIYSKHPERFIERRWLQGQRFHFGDVEVHADVRAKTRPDCVQYWWEGIWGPGGSAWDARKLAHFMGFSPIVLCGCPLVPGRYVSGDNFGGLMHRADVVQDLVDSVSRETEWHEGAYSMSGATREILGSP